MVTVKLYFEKQHWLTLFDSIYTNNARLTLLFVSPLGTVVSFPLLDLPITRHDRTTFDFRLYFRRQRRGASPRPAGSRRPRIFTMAITAQTQAAHRRSSNRTTAYTDHLDRTPPPRTHLVDAPGGSTLVHKRLALPVASDSQVLGPLLRPCLPIHHQSSWQPPVRTDRRLCLPRSRYLRALPSAQVNRTFPDPAAWPQDSANLYQLRSGPFCTDRPLRRRGSGVFRPSPGVPSRLRQSQLPGMALRRSPRHPLRPSRIDPPPHHP